MSNQLHRRISHQAEVDLADQRRAARLRGTDGAFGLAQGTDVGTERDDSAEHQGDRSERRGLPCPQQPSIASSSSTGPAPMAILDARMIFRQRSAIPASSSIRASIAEISSVGSSSVMGLAGSKGG